jgi:hypothetical protein
VALITPLAKRKVMKAEVTLEQIFEENMLSVKLKKVDGIKHQIKNSGESTREYKSHALPPKQER